MREMNENRARMAIMRLETMQDEALDNLGNTKHAYSCCIDARGYLKCLKDLDLLTSDERERLTRKQLNLYERINDVKAKQKKLNEVGKLSSADNK